MVFGMVEASAFLTFQSLDLWSWESREVSVDPNIFWAAILVDLGLCLAAGILLIPILIRIRECYRLPVAVTLFSAMGFYALLSVSGRIHEVGIISMSLGLATLIGRWVNKNSQAKLALFRRSLPAVFGICVGVCLGAVGWMKWQESHEIAQLPPARSGSPNVLLIVLDALRADRLGSYGYPRPTSPFLDDFAKKSVRFEKAIADSSWTLPSHVSMFTGRIPSEHGAILDPFDNSYPTIAGELNSRGYATVGIVANSFLATRVQGLAHGFVHWENIFTGPADSFRRTSVGRRIEKLIAGRLIGRVYPPGRMTATDVNRRFLDWLDHRPDRPFFAFLNYMEMHEPYAPPAEFAAKFNEHPEDIVFEYRWRRKTPPNQEMKKYLDDGYDASLAYLDSQLLVLFAELQKRGLEQNLLVIITSDHGQSLLDHDMIGHKTSLYREQIHVPLLIRFPGRVPQGVVVSKPAGLLRIPATILGLAGFTPAAFPPLSLEEYWSEPELADRPVFSELAGAPQPVSAHDQFMPSAQGWVKSVVHGDWHYLLQQNGKTQLFRWSHDAAELHDLAQSNEGKKVAAALNRILMERLARVSPSAASADSN
jgi:arylsulfatase A-like enzyme